MANIRSREPENPHPFITAGAVAPVPASLYIPVTWTGPMTTKNFQVAAAAAIASILVPPNYSFIDFSETGDTRPAGVEITAYVGNGEGTGDTPHTVYGVRAGPAGNLVLDKLTDAVLSFVDTVGDLTFHGPGNPSLAHATSASTVPTDDLTSRGGDAIANTGQPAGFRVYVPNIYMGVLVASGLGNASNLLVTHARFW